MGLGIASDHSQDALAAAAMVTDGPRFSGGRGYQPGMSTLPPYSAGSSSPTPMAGRDYEIGLVDTKGGGANTEMRDMCVCVYYATRGVSWIVGLRDTRTGNRQPLSSLVLIGAGALLLHPGARA